MYLRAKVGVLWLPIYPWAYWLSFQPAVLANLVNVIVDLRARKSVHGKGSRVRIFVNVGGEETICLMLDVDSERP